MTTMESKTRLTRQPEYDEVKFTELVLFIAEKMEDEPSFGATMLNKVLFYSDFWHYADTGVPITGAVYQRLRNGPAPPRLLPVQAELIRNGEARLRQVGMGRFVQKRLIADRAPDLSVFTAAEIAYVQNVIDECKEHSATAISHISHTMPAWKITRPGETIPYEAVFIYDGPVTADDEKTAERLLDELGPHMERAGALGMR